MKTKRLAIPSNSIGYFDFSISGNILLGSLYGMYKTRRDKKIITFFQVELIRRCLVVRNTQDGVVEQVQGNPGDVVCIQPFVKIRELERLLPAISCGAKFEIQISTRAPLRLSGGRKVFNADVTTSCTKEADVSHLVLELPLKD